MNLNESQITEALSDMLDKGKNVNDLMQLVLNSMMKSERTAHLEESKDNKGNGYRLGKVFGFGTQLELRIPRDRRSNFMPKLLAILREEDTYLREVCFDLYSRGLTTRDISSAMEKIYGGSFSKSKISNISQSFYEEMEAWRNRELDSHYLAFYIDGIHVKLRRGVHYETECFYVIMALREDYRREIVAVVNRPTESASSWEMIFKDLKKRGVESVGLIVSDGLSGLEKSISSVFGGTPHQKCIVHLQRILKDYVRPKDREELAEDMRYVFSPEKDNYTQDMAHKALLNVGDKWGKKYKSLEKYIRKLDWQPYFTYLNYDKRVRRMIYTTNWIERFNRSARRTLKIRGAFPDEDSVLALITATAREKEEKTYNYPIYNFKFEPKLMRKKKE